MNKRPKKSDLLIRDIAQLFVTYSRAEWEPVLSQLSEAGDAYRGVRDKIIDLIEEREKAQRAVQRAGKSAAASTGKNKKTDAAKLPSRAVITRNPRQVAAERSGGLDALEAALDSRQILPSASMLREFYRLAGGKGALPSTSRKASVEQVIEQVASLSSEAQSTLLRSVARLGNQTEADEAYSRWFSLIHHDERSKGYGDLEALERDVYHRWLLKAAEHRSSPESLAFSQISFALEPEAHLKKEAVAAAVLRSGRLVENPFSVIHQGQVQWRADGCEGFRAPDGMDDQGGFVRALAKGQFSLITTLPIDRDPHASEGARIMDMDRPLTRLLGALYVARGLAEAAKLQDARIIFRTRWSGLSGWRLSFGGGRHPAQAGAQDDRAETGGTIAADASETELRAAVMTAARPLLSAFGVVRTPAELTSYTGQSTARHRSD